MIVGDGGAAAVSSLTGRSRGAAPGSLTSITSTVGAPQKCVASPALKRRQMSGGSTLGMQTLAAPTAAQAQVMVQPLQWNMGRVHTYLDSASSRRSIAIAIAFKSAPRWWYITPFR